MMKKLLIGKLPRRALIWTLIVSLLSGVITPATLSAKDLLASQLAEVATQASATADGPLPNDIQGHWAEGAIAEWIKLGLIQGYEDGSFRPNQTISRIEFVTLVNRAFGFSGGGAISFADVPAGAWYIPQIQAAKAAAYIGGYTDGTFRPQGKLSRVEAGTILSRLVPVVSRSSEEPLGQFADRESVPSYGHDPLNAVLASGYMEGFPDRTLRPLQPITRAEAVTLLNRLLKQSNSGVPGRIVISAKNLDAAGTYGPATGNFNVVGGLTVLAPDTVLRNLTVTGDLVIGASVGEGDVTLDHVTVRGRTFVNGGGEHSVHMNDSSLGTVVVDKTGGRVRVVIDGTTVIEQMDVQSDALIESDGSEGGGISGVVITATGEVVLSGAFAKVEVRSDVRLTVTSGTIAELQVGESSSASKIALGDGVIVDNMELHGIASVTGEGTIQHALVDAVGVTFETKPKVVETTDRGGLTGGGVAGIPTGPVGPTVPTNPTNPNPPIDSTISVVVSATQPQMTGVRVVLNPAVAGLTAANFNVRTSGGQSATVTFAGSLDGGATYALSAALTEGQTYTVMATKTGYAFGSPVAFTVPVTTDPGTDSGTDPNAVSVTASVYDIGATSFSLAFDGAVEGLTTSDLTLNHQGDAVGVLSADTADNGLSYSVVAMLSEGQTYTLTIAKAGYSFGSPLTIQVPGSGTTDPGETSDVVVTATASQLSTAGFKLSLDKPVSELEMDSFVITNGDNERVGVDMLASVSAGREYEVYAALAIGKSYTIALNKAGYAFTEPLVLKVAAIDAASSVGWVSFGGFQLNLDRSVSDMSIERAEVMNVGGAAVADASVQVGSGGRTLVVAGTFTAGATYHYRIYIGDYVFEGDVAVPVTIPVSRYTTFETTSNGSTSLRVTFSVPVPGLTADSFLLSHNNGTPYLIGSVSTTDGGSSYVIGPDNAAYSDYVLDVEQSGYDFGGSKKVIRTTLNPWYGTSPYPGFFAGFNPSLPGGVTANDFRVTDERGSPVSVVSVESEQGGFVVRYDGVRGQTFRIEIIKDGYDFGAPRSNTAAYSNKVLNPSYTGFTLSLNPPVAIDTVRGFRLNRMTADYQIGATVPIQGVTTSNGGSSYEIAASLTPGNYRLLIDAPIEMTVYYFTVSAVATIAVGKVLNTGIRVSLDYAVDGLDASSFQIVNVETDAQVWISAADTQDHGRTYWLSAELPGRNYVVKLNGHLPVGGVAFQVQGTLDAGNFSALNPTGTGFDLAFDNPVPGLLPADIDLRDAQNNRVVGLTLSTSDGGRTYRIHATLGGNKDYTLTLSKAFVRFGPAVSFHVPYSLTATVTETNRDGWIELRLSQPLTEAQSGGIVAKDDEGNTFYPYEYVMSGGGTVYRIRLANISITRSYMLDLNPGANPDLAAYRLTSPTFAFPVAITSAIASPTGVTVQFEAPVAGLTKANFVIRGASGETYATSAAATADGGSSYALTAALVLGKSYTVQYKPNASYQTATGIPFVASKTIAATIKNVTAQGFKLQFGEKVAGLLQSQVVLRDAGGNVVGQYLYSFTTADQGLSYQFRYDVGAGVLEPGAGYTLAIAREEFALAAPIAFDIPIPGVVTVDGTTNSDIVLTIGAYPYPMPELAAGNFDLRDGKGKLLAVTLTKLSGNQYKLTGALDTLATYTLTVSYPGYDFGSSLSIGMRILVGLDTGLQTQHGFTLFVSPALPNLAASEITISDRDGHTISAQSAVAALNGSAYQVTAPLAAGKKYTVSIAKPGYEVKFSIPFSLNKRSATVDRVSVNGFTLNFDRMLSWSSALKLKVLDDQGAEQRTTGIVSNDGGVSYQIEVALTPDRVYTVEIDRIGDDFGPGIPVIVKSVGVSFAGMEEGSSRTFDLVLDQPLPGMRPGDFVLRRASDGRKIALLSAETADGGISYKLSADFFQAESYTIVPAKDGYAFGDPIAFTVPILATPAVLRTGPKEIEIGFNVAVPGLNAGEVTLRDADGNVWLADTVVTADGGSTYTIRANFVGGRRYSLSLAKSGYDLGDELTVEVPNAITAKLDQASEAGLTLVLSPAVNGLDANDFQLRDSNGQPVAVADASSANDGTTYKLSTGLTGGELYTLTISLAGYDFGAPLVADIPIAVGVTYEDAEATGLTIRLNRAVPGLSAGNVALTDQVGGSTVITALTTTDGGLTYTLQASLQEKKRYSLRLTKSRYDFGADGTFLVPVKVGVAVSPFLSSGFTIKLNRAVPGLTAGNVTLKDTVGKAVPIVSWTASEDGATYVAQAELAGHAIYTLQVIADGYAFGSAAQLEAQPVVLLSARNIDANGFELVLSEPIPRLNIAYLFLAGSDGIRIPLNAVSFYDQSGAANTGLVYKVNKPLALGIPYTLSIEDPAHPTTGPLEVIAPRAVTVQVTGLSKDGLALKFNQLVNGLLAEDISLLAEDGSPIAVEDVVPGETAANYTIRTKLQEDRTYTLSLRKRGYDFGTSGNVSVQVPTTVAATVKNANEAGFTIVLSKPVQNLNISLFKDGFVKGYYDLTITTPDEGRTYQVGVSWPSDYPLTLALSKSGYDLGPDRTVQYQKKKPELQQALTSADGASVLLTFDARMMSSASDVGFAVKINSTWQSNVRVAFVNATTFKLTWTGPLVKSSDKVSVAFTGINRVTGENRAYLAPFAETPAINSSSELGLVQNYAYIGDPKPAAQLLHSQFGYGALETAVLLRQGGFAAAKISGALSSEYGLDRTALIRVYADMGADAGTAFDALHEISYLPNTPEEWIASFLQAGYAAVETGTVFRAKGYQVKDIVRAFRLKGVSAGDAARAMRYSFGEANASAAVAQLKGLYDGTNVADAVQLAYGLSNADAVLALFAGGVIASDAATAIVSLYSADVLVEVALLRDAGYAPKDIGAAIRQGSGFENARTAVKTMNGAGMQPRDVYLFVGGLYTPTEAAVAMLREQMSGYAVAGAVQASGDGALIAINALRQSGAEDEAVAGFVKAAWGSSLTLQETAKQFVQSGMTKEKAASLLHNVYEADVIDAFVALEPLFHPWGFDSKGLFLALLKGGYDPAEVAAYFLKHVYAGRSPVFDVFVNEAQYPIDRTLAYVHDAITADGTPYPMQDAVYDLFAFGARYSAQDALAALRGAYANDANEAPTAANLAAAMSKMYTLNDYGPALVKQMGLSLPMWLELQTTNCPCNASKLAKDAKYMFGLSSVGDITLALGATGKFTLRELIDGVISLYPGNSRESQMAPLTGVLRDSGYAIAELAAVYDDEGWDWIRSFSRYGIAAKESASYLIGKGFSKNDVVLKLRPYPAKDIALVLREQYGLSDADAIAALTDQHFYDENEISSAVAWAYNGNPVALWVKTLRAQGATAGSVISLLISRYPEYRDPGLAGTALVKGGYAMDEVMQALIRRSSNPDLQNTIATLNQLFAQSQISIAQLLAASSSESPESGLLFLKNAKFTRAQLAWALKDYYGVDAGKAASLLSDQYPYDLSQVMQTVADVYGQSKAATAALALDAEGITTLAGAVTYLRDAGFGLKDIALAAKTKFNAPIGETAQRLTEGSNEGANVILYAVAGAYGLTAEHAIHELLAYRGQTSYAQAIAFLYAGQQFGLPTAAKLAKEEYGLSSGEALQQLRAFRMYADKDVANAIALAYGVSQNQSVVDSLEASGIAALEDAVSYLLRMNFDLASIVRVGKEHYGLNQSQVAAALDASGFFDAAGTEAVNAIALVYGQTLSETIVDILDGLGATTYAEALPELRLRGFTLDDMVLAAKEHYRLSTGEMLSALLPKAWYPLTDVTAAVFSIYGKPFSESVGDLLRDAVVATAEEATPMLRQMGYSLKEVATAAREVYGLTAEQAIASLKNADAGNAAMIEAAVADAYGTQVASSAVGLLNAVGGIADPAAAVAYLQGAGVPLGEIAGTLGSVYGLMPSEIAGTLAATGLYDAASILYALTANAASGTSVTGILSKLGITTASTAAATLKEAGFSLDDIAMTMKLDFSQSPTQTKAILTSLGRYGASAIERVVSAAYQEQPNASDSLSYILDSYGITTAEGAVAFLSKSKSTAKSAALQLKNHYGTDADRASDLLRTYYDAGDVTLAISAVYYTGTNLSMLEQLIPPGYASQPSHVANYLSGKMTLKDIAVAMKELFHLSALDAMDAMSAVNATPEALYNSVTEVYGGDPLFAKLADQKNKGASAAVVAVDMYRYGKLTYDDKYLVDTLDSLGYSDAEILSVRYMYFNAGKRNEGTVEEQAALLTRFGVNTPDAIVNFLILKYGRGGTVNAVVFARIVRAGLPEASMKDFALTMAAQGFNHGDIENAFGYLNEDKRALSDNLKTLGYSAYEAAGFVGRVYDVIDDKVRVLKGNGYTLESYIRYLNFNAALVKALRESGFSASEIAIAAVRSGAEGNYARIAMDLRDGGFTDLKVIVGAILDTGYRPEWIPNDLREIASLKDLAKAMNDSGKASLTQIVTGLKIAEANNKMIYDIVKEISKQEQAAFTDELSFAERKALDDDDIAILMTIGSLREAGFSSHDSAGLLTYETGDWMTAALILILSGYDWDDVLGAVWDEYRGAIGVMILQTMMGQAIGKVMQDFKQYWKLVKIVKRIVKKEIT
ncbi:S-layer homology domain-containing protein [Cohnella yongneupensis]|uniref:S-layer homology domain-containing protein n=1 Tax=Cohnella yongneupensis TaxID=425006 RepID=A0ABW0R4E5_9BACL